jgi:hypothetical protein
MNALTENVRSYVAALEADAIFRDDEKTEYRRAIENDTSIVPHGLPSAVIAIARSRVRAGIAKAASVVRAVTEIGVTPWVSLFRREFYRNV